MPLWGKQDAVAVTGTVVLTNNSVTVAGNTASALNTELKIGSVVSLSTANTAAGANTRYRVGAIANGTSITVDQAYNGTTNAAASISLQTQPKYILQGGAPGQRTIDVVGVDVTEAQLAANKAKGIVSPGWVSYQTYQTSDGKTRNKAETLVFVKSMTQAVANDANDDTTVADA